MAVRYIVDGGVTGRRDGVLGGLVDQDVANGN